MASAGFSNDIECCGRNGKEYEGIEMPSRDEISVEGGVQRSL